ncbi:MAG: hypothetical protein PWQ64_465 [Desulfomicrobiaceae bacterium]|nr:hypothetical protein [Desulfomicrobiaceae bacterium]
MMGNWGAWRGRRCQGCGAVVAEGWLCAQCSRHMPRQTHSFCPCCGEIRAGAAGPPLVCGRCRLDPPPWSAVAFWGGYAGPLRRLLVRLKFAGELGLVGVLGWMMAEAVQARGLAADVVVPVPMRPSGLVERGFNQSVELGRMLSRRMGWPMRQLLTKIRDTERQARLSCAERQVNVGGAFVSAPVHGLRVAVVDDIMTTGATARACAWALKATGAREVWCAVVARA